MRINLFESTCCEEQKAGNRGLSPIPLTPLDAQTDEAAEEGGHFPAQAQLCDKCHFKAKVLLDGCLTCLNCGDSKCG